MQLQDYIETPVVSVRLLTSIVASWIDTNYPPLGDSLGKLYISCDKTAKDLSCCFCRCPFPMLYMHA